MSLLVRAQLRAQWIKQKLISKSCRTPEVLESWEQKGIRSNDQCPFTNSRTRGPVKAQLPSSAPVKLLGRPGDPVDPDEYVVGYAGTHALKVIQTTRTTIIQS